MDLKQLQFFLTCSETGSFTKAAEKLYTTQPNVSQVIRSFENDLGAELFSRSRTGITLTPEGERIYYYAQNILKNAELIMTAGSDSAGRNLRIAVNPSSSLAFLTESFIHPLLSEGLKMRYIECGVERMMELLRNYQYDLGLLFVPSNKVPAFSQMTERYHLTYTELRVTDLVVHSGPSGAFYRKPLVKPDELNGCSLIQLEDDFFSLEDLILDEPSFRSGKYSLKNVVRTNSDHLMIRMLRNSPLCNIGSYWNKRNFGEYDFSMSTIDGFQGRISFGYLHIDNRPLRDEAAGFIEALNARILDDPA